MIAAGNDALWQRLRGRARARRRPRFRTNPDRVRNRDALRASIEGALAGKPTGEWEVLLVDAGVPAARVRTVNEAMDDEHTAALGILQQLGAGLTVAPPMRLDGERPLYPGPAASAR